MIETRRQSSLRRAWSVSNAAKSRRLWTMRLGDRPKFSINSTPAQSACSR